MQVSRITLRVNGSCPTICWMASIKSTKEHECKDSRSRQVFHVCEIQLDWFGPTIDGDLYFEECFHLVNAFDLSRKRNKWTGHNPHCVTQSESLELSLFWVVLEILIHSHSLRAATLALKCHRTS